MLKLASGKINLVLFKSLVRDSFFTEFFAIFVFASVLHITGVIRNKKFQTKRGELQ